jgi:hypothetical protein
MQSEQLKPCPFCDCEAWMHKHGGIFGSEPGYRVECEGKCHAMTCYWHTESEAYQQWNTRATPPSPWRPIGEASIVDTIDIWSNGDRYTDCAWFENLGWCDWNYHENCHTPIPNPTHFMDIPPAPERSE